MTPLFRSRRDAEELHAALSGQAVPDVERRHSDLLRTVDLLRAHQPAQPRPAFLSDLRVELMAAAQTDLVAMPTPQRTATQQSPARRRLGTAAASLVIVGSSAGMAVAAQGSLPGDPLYPIKRGAEQVETTLRLSEAAKGQAELRHAEERLGEAEALQASDADSAQVVAAIEDFRVSAESGSARLFRSYAADANPDDVTAVRQFAGDQLPTLERIGSADDPALEPVLLDAADTLSTLDRQARTLCSSCGESVAFAMPESLASAASAASLDVLLARPAEQAQLDSEVISALDRRQIAALVARAEQVAAEPTLPSGEEWPQATAPQTRTPVASEVTRVGTSLQEPVRGTTRVVDDLVTGLGTAVSGVGTRTKVRSGGTPLEEPVRELTDTVDDAVEGVTDVTGLLAD